MTAAPSVVAAVIERRKQILITLRRLSWLTSLQLAREHGVSTRTIWRDIEALRDEGHRINALTGNGGGYGLAPVKVSKPKAEETENVR